MPGFLPELSPQHWVGVSGRHIVEEGHEVSPISPSFIKLPFTDGGFL
jgi:hypothetical protein